MYDWIFLCKVFQTNGNRLAAFQQWNELYQKHDREVPTTPNKARARLMLSSSVPTDTVIELVQQVLEQYPDWFVIPEIPTGATLSLPLNSTGDFVMPTGFILPDPR